MIGLFFWVKTLAFGFHSTPQRASVVTLQCRDGLVNLARGESSWAERTPIRSLPTAPDDLHLCGAALPEKPPPPEGQGGLEESSSAARLARRVGLHSGVLTLVLSIWKAGIHFLVVEEL